MQRRRNGGPDQNRAQAPAFNRIAAKRRLAGWLLGRFFIRFHVLLIVAFSFAAGLASSRLALEAGVDSPLLRYPIVVLASYAAFLLALRAWLWYAGFSRHFAQRDWWGDPGGAIDIPAAGSGVPPTGDLAAQDIRAGAIAAGKFGGGGASGEWSPPVDLTRADIPEPAALELPAVDLGDVAGGDEGCGVFVLLLAALAVLLAVLGIGVHLLSSGPLILAEVALEAAMAAGFFGTVNRVDNPGWMGGAIAASWQYFFVLMALACVLALTIGALAPGSRTLMEAFRILI